MSLVSHAWAPDPTPGREKAECAENAEKCNG
ncbi:hypothetical protein A2U01_0109191, partial [Trifolium medium]|nr:hypothetical protein [Trifolium medium]